MPEAGGGEKAVLNGYKAEGEEGKMFQSHTGVMDTRKLWMDPRRLSSDLYRYAVA